MQEAPRANLLFRQKYFSARPPSTPNLCRVSSGNSSGVEGEASKSHGYSRGLAAQDVARWHFLKLRPAESRRRAEARCSVMAKRYRIVLSPLRQHADPSAAYLCFGVVSLLRRRVSASASCLCFGGVSLLRQRVSASAARRSFGSSSPGRQDSFSEIACLDSRGPL